jgi:hypothetical protein
MKRLFIVLIISLTVCASVHASDLEKESHVENAVETSMNLLKKGTVAEFIDSLRPIWNKPEAEINTITEQVKKQRVEAHKRFGKTLGVQFVDTKNVEDILIKIYYIEKFEKAAMRWTFNFYKPEERWVLSSFVWDQNTDILFNND